MNFLITLFTDMPTVAYMTLFSCLLFIIGLFTYHRDDWTSYAAALGINFFSIALWIAVFN